MKHHHLNVRTSEHEHAAIARRAKKSGLTISEYVRRCCLNDTNRPVINADTELLQSIYRNLRHTGGNINQIACWLNTHPNNAGSFDGQLKNALDANEKASSELAEFIAAVKASV